MSGFDVLLLWVGRVVMLAGGLALTLVLVWLLIDFTFKRSLLLKEFALAAAQVMQDRARKQRAAQPNTEEEQ